MLSDLRFAGRLLSRKPALSCAVVISLALAIGANTAMFSLLDLVLLRPLPVPQPEQLRIITSAGRESRFNTLSHPVYLDLRKHYPVAAFSTAALTLSSNDGSTRVAGDLVSGNYFQVLGVKAAIGRLIAPDDDVTPGGHAVVVMSFPFWKRQFGADPKVIGSRIRLNATTYQVIGVTAPEFYGFRLGSVPDVWLPLAMQGQTKTGRPWLGDPNWNWLQLFMRVPPGSTAERVEAHLNTVYAGILQQDADERQLRDGLRRQSLSQKLILEPGSQGAGSFRDRYSRGLLVLMGMAAVVLLIGCANVANLLVSRAVARRKEIAVRMAVGANRIRIVRQLLTESLALSISGGAIGVLLCMWLVDFLIALLPESDAGSGIQWSLNRRILAFNFAVSVLTGMVFGLAPALPASRPDLVSDLRSSAQSRLGRLAAGRILVAAQVGLCLALVFGAIVFGRTLWNLRGVEAGGDRSRLLLASVDPAAKDYRDGQLLQFYDRLLEKARGLPGVGSAALARGRVLSGGRMTWTVRIPGHVPGAGEDMNVNLHLVTPDYFRTMAISLAQGRDLERKDSGAAVVNQALARRFFGTGDVLGRTIVAAGQTHTIVGVAGDQPNANLREPVPPTLFIPLLANAEMAGRATIYLRTLLPPEVVVPQLRSALRSLDRDLPLYGTRTLAGEADLLLSRERIIAMLTASFASLALVLSMVGLYGVLAHSVTQRTREFGIRLALGAEPSDLRRMVFRQYVVLVGAGIGAGIPLALAGVSVARSLLFGVEPGDPGTIIGSAFCLLAAGLAASLIPLRRAARIEPLAALREE